MGFQRIIRTPNLLKAGLEYIMFSLKERSWEKGNIKNIKNKRKYEYCVFEDNIAEWKDKSRRL